MQDIGLILLLLCLGAAAVITANAPAAMRTEFTVMLLCTYLAVMLAGYKLDTLSVMAAALETLVYTAYKLFFFFAASEAIAPVCFVWLPLPLLSVGSMTLFIYENRRTEMENDMLKEQVEDLVMINSLTGLYNLRSMYHDLQIQLAYSKRNDLAVSLLIIKLRYGEELKKVLSRRQFETLIQAMAVTVSDSVRLEDRVYSLDNDGSMGVILTCDQTNSKLVQDRIRARLEKKDAFADMMDRSVRVEVKIACLEYDEDKYGSNMMQFKQAVENELQYNV